MESEDMLVLETSYLFSEGSNPFVINFVRCCFIQEKLNLKTYLIEKELNFWIIAYLAQNLKILLLFL